MDALSLVKTTQFNTQISVRHKLYQVPTGLIQDIQFKQRSKVHKTSLQKWSGPQPLGVSSKEVVTTITQPKEYDFSLKYQQAVPLHLNKQTLKYTGLAQVPTYDTSKVGESWVHIGLGNFHRAHQAVYADDLLELFGPSQWGICGIGLMKQDQLIGEVLSKQDYYYTVVERSPVQDKARIIGSVRNFIYAFEDREVAIEKLASEKTKIVSLTITEKGYHTIQDTEDLDIKHPEIQHDLLYPEKPIGVYGFLAASLQRRRQRGLQPYTIMSCDNVTHNGDVIKKTLLQFVEALDSSLYKWLAQYGAFPNTMVDRITPSFNLETQQFVKDTFQIDDGWPIQTEFFRQWVIQDNFTLGRPEFQKVGVQMVQDVYSYEKLKLHILNLSHSAICYYGALVGYEYVHQAIEDKYVILLLKQIMDKEITPNLLPVPGVNIEEYKQKIIERFSNPKISDTLMRITMDSNAKILKFVIPPIQESLEKGQDIRGLTFIIASWFRFLQGITEAGEEYTILDVNSARLQRLAQLGGKDPNALMQLKDIFGEKLFMNKEFRSRLKTTLYDFYEIGAKETLINLLKDTRQLKQD